MKTGAFDLIDPVPELHDPVVLATLRPWIDVNNVGSSLLRELAGHFSAFELGRLWRPAHFYDYTRYRPTIDIHGEIRDMTVPNTTTQYARREGQSDIVLLDLLEPHMNADRYVDSVVKVLALLKISKYVLLGSMYDVVPHTRPLLVSGYGMGERALQDVRMAGALPITYEGPSTYANLITRKAADLGIDAEVFIVSLPQYVVIEEDFLGKVRLMEVLNTLFNIPIDKDEIEKALRQREMVTEKLKGSPDVQNIMSELEENYDMRVRAMEKEGIYQLGSDMEEIFWKTIEKNIGKA